jgi:parallel beta-helix repeat protein
MPPRSWPPAAAVLASIALLAAACADMASTAVVLPTPPAVSSARPAPGAGTARSTIYVDQQIAAASCLTYAPDQRACGGGTAVAYRSLDEASAAAAPGAQVVLREGQFTSSFAPARSGTAEALITYRSHPGETVTFTGIPEEPAIVVRDRSYLAFEGLTVTGVQGWGRLEDASWIVFRGNHFSAALARGTRGGLKLVRSHYNTITGNTFEEGNDNLVLQESDRNLVVGNTLRFGRHSLLSIRCGNLNVIRSNQLFNERQKAGEVYDCEGVSDAPLRLDATKRNLFEGNLFLLTREAGEPHRYNGIQYSGQLGIVRKNVFHDNRGGALRFHVYPREALQNYGHRVYQNTFYLNRCFAVSSSTGAGGWFGDILFVGNILYKNTDCAGQDRQIGVENPAAVSVRWNASVEPRAPSPFRDVDKLDLRLRPGTAFVDGGGFLTQTVGAGEGTAMPVDDVKWFFFDPAGIEEHAGDAIQLEGGAQARIRGIDYASRVLTLDRPLSWKKGQGVAIPFAGKAPDMGAYELLPEPQSFAPWLLTSAGALAWHRQPQISPWSPAAGPSPAR